MKSVENLERKITKELGKEGWKLAYRRYNYWDNVLCCVKTEEKDLGFGVQEVETKVALVWDIYDRYGGQSIISGLKENTTWEYIKEVIKGEYESLGLLNYKNTGFGVKQRFLAWEV